MCTVASFYPITVELTLLRSQCVETATRSDNPRRVPTPRGSLSLHIARVPPAPQMLQINSTSFSTFKFDKIVANVTQYIF